MKASYEPIRIVRLVFLQVIALLAAFSAVSAYPSHQQAPHPLLLHAFARRTVTDGMESARWVKKQSPQSDSTTCTADGADCVWYIGLPWENREFEVIVQLKDEASSLQMTGLGTAVCDTLTSRTVYACKVSAQSQGSQQWRLIIDGENDEPQTLYLARHVFVQLRSPVSGCNGLGVCIGANAPTNIDLRITNSAELDPTKTSASAGLDVDASSGSLMIRVAQNALGSRTVTFETRQPYINSTEKWTRQVTVTETFVHPDAIANVVTLGSEGQSITDIFVGEQIVTGIAGFTQQAEEGDLYELRQQTSEQAVTVAYVQFLSVDLVRLYGVKPTTASARNGTRPMLTAHVSGAAAEAAPAFVVPLQVRDVPVVRRYSAQQLDPYSDTLLHRGATTRITLEGTGLDAFEAFEIEEWDYGLTPLSKSSNALIFDITVPASTRGKEIRLALRSPLVSESKVKLPVADAGRPRPINFGWIVSNGDVDLEVNRPRAIAAAARVKAADQDQGRSARFLPLDSLVIIDLDKQSLRDLWLVFDPALVDRGQPHGVQYLEVVAELRRRKFLDRDPSDYKEVIARGSTKIAVVPNELYEVQEGYATDNLVSIDELVGHAGRDTPPKAELLLTVRHDPARYGSVDGYTSKIVVRDDRKFRVDFNLTLPSGLFSIAKRREPSRSLVRNGFGADTIVTGRNTWGAELAAMAGAASMDVAFLRSDGRPSWARLRTSLYYLQSPFTDTQVNRFALAVQYPVHLFSAGFLQASISVGPTCLVEQTFRCFYILAPGFTIGEAR